MPYVTEKTKPTAASRERQTRLQFLELRPQESILLLDCGNMLNGTFENLTFARLRAHLSASHCTTISLCKAVLACHAICIRVYV